MPRRSPLRLAALFALLAACSNGAIALHPRDGSSERGDADAASTTPDASAPCDAPMTPVAELDAFVAQFGAALVPQLPSWRAERSIAEEWAYARRRVEMGELVVRPDHAAACVAYVADGHPWAGSCSTVLAPRCPAPVGTACGRDFDCDPGMWCAERFACMRRGHCTPRVPLGEVCDPNFDSCVHPEPGFSGIFGTSLCLPATGGEHRCRAVSGIEGHAGDACQTRTARGDTVEITYCASGLSCRDGVCVSLPSDSPEGAPCDLALENCAAHLECIAGTCTRADTLTCTHDDYGGCMSGPLACVDADCVRTDGTRGARCDPGSSWPDCGAGLACGADGRCGDPLPLGAPCGYFGTECASGCCDADATLHGSCVPFGG